MERHRKPVHISWYLVANFFLALSGLAVFQIPVNLPSNLAVAGFYLGMALWMAICSVVCFSAINYLKPVGSGFFAWAYSDRMMKFNGFITFVFAVLAIILAFLS